LHFQVAVIIRDKDRLFDHGKADIRFIAKDAVIGSQVLASGLHMVTDGHSSCAEGGVPLVRLSGRAGSIEHESTIGSIAGCGEVSGSSCWMG